MFIDDNPSNRAEAAAIVPELQIEDENIIAHLLADQRLQGKDDGNLIRLAQYKLLESRKRDEQQSAAGNEEFLRGCDVRVLIDYDLDRIANLDRAIELINRTNQLNYTKRRLPEEIERARQQLREELKGFNRQAGLVHVVDKYGDYGIVGFFMVVTDVFRPLPDKVSNRDFRTLRYFCFSCRTLGMLVEQWLYDHLGRPQLKIVGEVLTDLSVERTIDWIRLVQACSDSHKKIEPVAPELRLYGGCEMHAISVYLQAYSQNIEAMGNFSANGVFFRINSSALALSAFARGGDQFIAECKLLGVPPNLVSGDYFTTAPLNTAFVFSGAFDIQGRSHYKHARTGWEFVMEIAGCNALNLVEDDQTEILRRIDALPDFDAAGRGHLADVARHVRAHYLGTGRITDERRISTMKSLIERVSVGSKLVLLLDHNRLRLPDGTVRSDPPTDHYNKLMRSLSANYSFVDTVCFSDVINSDDEIQIGGNHYDRAVYVRIAEKIVQSLRVLRERESVNNIIVYKEAV